MRLHTVVVSTTLCLVSSSTRVASLVGYRYVMLNLELTSRDSSMTGPVWSGLLCVLIWVRPNAPRPARARQAHPGTMIRMATSTSVAVCPAIEAAHLIKSTICRLAYPLSQI
jgi:hypothetical protein